MIAPCRLDALRLAQRLADFTAHDLEERPRHRAADSSFSTRGRSSVIASILSSAFAPPRITMKPSPDASRQLRQLPQAPRPPAARHAGVDELGNAHGRGVCAVHGAERVVHVTAPHRRQAPSRTPGRSSSRRRGSAYSQAAAPRPHRRSARICATSSPMQSGAIATGASSISFSRSATGLRENSGSGASAGRPRCEQSVTGQPASSSTLMVGRAASMRVSSVISPSWSGTLKSTRTSVRCPESSTSLMVLLPRHGPFPPRITGPARVGVHGTRRRPIAGAAPLLAGEA
jgi:hypothetical protein